MIYVNAESEGKRLCTDIIKLYCITDLLHAEATTMEPKKERLGLGLIAVHLWRLMCTAIEEHFVLSVLEALYIIIITMTKSMKASSPSRVLCIPGKDLFGGPFTTFTGNTTGLNPVRVDGSDVWVHFSSDHLDGDRPYRGFSLSYKILFYQPPTSQHSLLDAGRPCSV